MVEPTIAGLVHRFTRAGVAQHHPDQCTRRDVLRELDNMQLRFTQPRDQLVVILNGGGALIGLSFEPEPSTNPESLLAQRIQYHIARAQRGVHKALKAAERAGSGPAVRRGAAHRHRAAVLADASRRLPGLNGAGRSADGIATAHVDGDRRLVRLRLEPGSLNRHDPDEIADRVIDATSLAGEDVQKRQCTVVLNLLAAPR